MSTYEFIPARSAHSIIGAAFACEMGVPVSPDLIAALIQKYDSDERVRRLLPRKSEDRGFSFSLDHQMARTEQSGGVVGVSFERFQEDGTVEWALSLRGNLLLVACNSYSRWSEICPEAIGLLQWGLECISPEGVGVVAYGLQYQDEFLWSGDALSMESAALFHADTELLPKLFLQKTGLWHNYAGWFGESVDGLTRDRLVNINVAFVKKENKGVAQIVMSHKGACAEKKPALDNMGQLFSIFHDEHTALLKELLSEPVKQKINLG